MSLISLVMVLVFVGVGLWMINLFIPRASIVSIRKLKNGTALDAASSKNNTLSHAVSHSQKFARIQRYVESLPPALANQLQAQRLRNSPVEPDGNMGPVVTFENGVLQIDYPKSWQASGQGDAVTITPVGGLVDDGSRRQALAYGLLVNVCEPHVSRNGFGLELRGAVVSGNSVIPVEEATDRLVQDLLLASADMRVVRNSEHIEVNGHSGLSTYLTNDSLTQGSGREMNWLVTLPRAKGLLFLLFTAPEWEFQSFEGTFQRMLDSVRLSS